MSHANPAPDQTVAGEHERAGAILTGNGISRWFGGIAALDEYTGHLGRCRRTARPLDRKNKNNCRSRFMPRHPSCSRIREISVESSLGCAKLRFRADRDRK